VGPTYKWCKIQENVKSGKHFPYGHLAGTIPQMHEGAENTKCRNDKIGVLLYKAVLYCDGDKHNFVTGKLWYKCRY